MAVFRNDHEAAAVRVQILEGELAQQRTQLVEAELERSRLNAALDAQSIDRLAATVPARPASTSRPASAPPPVVSSHTPYPPRLMTIAEWFLLAGFVALGLLSCAVLLSSKL
jgi:hypothetical protein